MKKCKNLCILALFLNAIGPTLSFFSLTTQSGYSESRALFYSVATYLLDLLSIAVFAIVLNKMENLSLEKAIQISIIVYISLWLFDVVDLFQPLRPLSNLGLIFSLWLLYRKLKTLGLEINSFFIC